MDLRLWIGCGLFIGVKWLGWYYRKYVKFWLFMIVVRCCVYMFVNYWVFVLMKFVCRLLNWLFLKVICRFCLIMFYMVCLLNMIILWCVGFWKVILMSLLLLRLVIFMFRGCWVCGLVYGFYVEVVVVYVVVNRISYVVMNVNIINFSIGLNIVFVGLCNIICR